MAVKEIKLGDYCDIEKGKTGIKKAIPGEYPMVVTAEDRITHNSYDFDCKAVIVPLVSSTGHGHASINRLHYQEGKFALGTILAAVKVKDESVLDPRFLYIYLSYFKDRLLVPLMKGSANVSLNIGKISGVEIILPTLGRQREIIRLEKEDEKIKLLRGEILHQKNLISLLRHSVLHDAMSGKMTEAWRADEVNKESAVELLYKIRKEKKKPINNKKTNKEQIVPEVSEDEKPSGLPKSWGVCRIQDIGVLKSGNSYNFEIGTEDDVPYVRVGDMNIEGNFDDVKESSSYYKYKPTMDGYLIRSGSIIFPKRGGAIATNKRCNVISKDILIDSNTMAISLSKHIDFAYFSWWFKTVDLSSLGNESVIPQVNNKDILPLVFPLPPYKEQKMIADRLEKMMHKISLLEVEVKKRESDAEVIMQAVLKDALVH